MNSLLDLRIENGMILFVPQDASVGKLGKTEYTPELWQLLTAKKWRIKLADGKPKYIYSSSTRRSLHHFILDYYWGEGASKAAVDRGMIVEHLNNDGFDCTIQNLFVLNKVKNTTKGFYFDPLAHKMIPIIAVRIFHVIANKTFQIVIAFNKSYFNIKTSGRLRTIKLLYPYKYDMVLQDAEAILEYFEKTDSFSIQELLQPLRCEKIRTKEDHVPPELFTEEEKMMPPGSIIEKNGEIYIIPGKSDDKATFIISSPYDNGWDL